MSGKRVLLVDDEKDFIDALSDRLAGRGLETDVAYDGMSAIELVRVNEYDAIVLDMVMPGMDGIETLKRVLEIDADLQVILLTAHGTVQTGVEAVKEGAADFLQKPSPLADILSRIQTAAAKKMLLVEKRTEAEISDILLRRGW